MVQVCRHGQARPGLCKRAHTLTSTRHVPPCAREQHTLLHSCLSLTSCFEVTSLISLLRKVLGPEPPSSGGWRAKGEGTP